MNKPPVIYSESATSTVAIAIIDNDITPVIAILNNTSLTPAQRELLGRVRHHLLRIKQSHKPPRER